MFFLRFHSCNFTNFSDVFFEFPFFKFTVAFSKRYGGRSFTFFFFFFNFLFYNIPFTEFVLLSG